MAWVAMKWTPQRVMMVVHASQAKGRMHDRPTTVSFFYLFIGTHIAFALQGMGPYQVKDATEAGVSIWYDNR